ncbi:hypothetical protein, partial [Burkholderia sp. LMG 13014]|uniref:hypothetical protein n=1 Tax=Burkholderia sp. LMG 13014 TaxID=2709306 RepID=UPI001964F50A
DMAYLPESFLWGRVALPYDDAASRMRSQSTRCALDTENRDIGWEIFEGLMIPRAGGGGGSGATTIGSNVATGLLGIAGLLRSSSGRLRFLSANCSLY